MFKKWWLPICVIFENKVFRLLLNHTEHLIIPAGESVSPECKAASTLATVWKRATDIEAVGKTSLHLNESLYHIKHTVRYSFCSLLCLVWTLS
jgi:hypothetical protein